jgi:AraC-like DNA-binding protein
MLVSSLADPVLRGALLRAARRDEDVVTDADDIDAALDQGFPRLVVADEEGRELLRRAGRAAPHVPRLTLTFRQVGAWEAARRAREIPPARVEWLGRRLQEQVSATTLSSTWVDRTLRDLARAAGRPLPTAFLGVARRVLEHPSRYEDLHEVAALAGMSRGAVKARFRRRDLPSPYTYVRWLRALAAAHVLSDPSVTVLCASTRLGFTSSGNFCRMLQTTTGLAPSRLREAGGRERLLITFARDHLGSGALDAWKTLGALFLRQSA